MKILVTGGAGYVGSHVVAHLVEAGHQVLVYDNLSTGDSRAVIGAELMVADLQDTRALRDTLRAGFDSVFHFAASVDVGESARDPLKYYANNTACSANLFYACAEARVKRIVLSSTAAVYGIPTKNPVTEDAPLNPINAYGDSKRLAEHILRSTSAAYGTNFVILRYFNVCGADPKLRIGQSTRNATHLFKTACAAALGFTDQFEIFGTDYPTADGTCIRDFIHVDDLARAHVAALALLVSKGGQNTFNCGYGRGFSVREVLEAVKVVSGKTFPVVSSGRREGDVPEIVASTSRITRALDWSPKFDDLRAMISHSLAWEANLDTWLRETPHRPFQRL